MGACLVVAALLGSAPLPARLHLEHALALGRAQQPQLRAAAAAAASAGALATQRRGRLLPQLGGTATWQDGTANFAARPGTLPSSAQAAAKVTHSGKMFEYWNFGLQATQLVWDFGTTLDAWRASRSSAEARRCSLEYARRSVDRGVRAAYFAAHAAAALAQVADETLVNQLRHQAQVEGFIAVGTRAEIDLAQARLDVANARVAQVQAHNAAAAARVRLNQAMGVEADIAYEVADSALDPVPDEAEGTEALLHAALAARPDVAALGADLTAAELDLGGAYGAYFPSVALSGSATEQGPALQRLTWNFSVGASLSWPLFAGGDTVGLVDGKQAARAALQAQLATLRQQVRLDVETARLAVAANKAVIEAAGDAVSNAEARLRYAERRYDTGVGSIIELSDAQLALSGARGQAIAAALALAAARADLLLALGA